MADDDKKEKKDDGGEKKKEGKNDKVFQFAGEMFGILLLAIIFQRRIIPLIVAWQNGALSFSNNPVYAAFQSFVFFLIIFSNILSILFFVGLIYSSLQLNIIEKKTKELFYPTPEEAVEEKPKNERWQRVIDHVSTDNPSDWRLSILEADITLDELLDNLGYVGDTIGDKLKKADKADFRTLDQAWEAHRIRNAIAHEGQDFTITQREARRIIGLYEIVFKEFDYI